MLSTITNYSSIINENFPTPGVDNDTSGFRNNFAAIKYAFSATSVEINNLNILNANNTASLVSSITTSVINSVTSIISTATAYSISAPTTSKGSVGDIEGMIFATSSATYICYANWQIPGTADIWAKSVTVGNSW